MRVDDASARFAPSRLRNGVAASSLQLPPGSWATVLDCLCAHFPAISRQQWVSRIERSLVLDATGVPIAPMTPYRVGLRVFYYREVPEEIAVPQVESIVYSDQHLVVADKPHFVAVTPGGSYVEDTLLARLIRRLGNPDLAPLHRIDRCTAGLVLFSPNRDTREHYQALFRDRAIFKSYEALAAPLPQFTFPLIRRSRIETGEPFFRMREVDGVPNAETGIDVIARGDDVWRYELRPMTGRKHQLRVHMAALGAAIINDDWYPELTRIDAQTSRPDDCNAPLKLLAKALSFVDPLTGGDRYFESSMTL